MKCIKELLLKVVPMEGEDGDLLPSLHTQQDIEKFAELIVRECLSVAEKEEDRYDSLVDELGEDAVMCANAMTEYQLAVKEHFGVE